jgi:NAD(P)H-hydrate repair Nnr-like enzyme with NAD(P)H-hydrate dehydratase domain
MRLVSTMSESTDQSSKAISQGVDLAHAICSPTAGNAMKTYAPDLIVHPILREDAYVSYRGHA